MKFHFPFTAGGAVPAPTAASTAADGGMIDVAAGKNEEDGDQRHHSIDRGARRPLITCERGSAGSTGSVGSKGVVRRIKK